MFLYEVDIRLQLLHLHHHNIVCLAIVLYRQLFYPLPDSVLDVHFYSGRIFFKYPSTTRWGSVPWPSFIINAAILWLILWIPISSSSVLLGIRLANTSWMIQHVAINLTGALLKLLMPMQHNRHCMLYKLLGVAWSRKEKFNVPYIFNTSVAVAQNIDISL